MAEAPPRSYRVQRIEVERIDHENKKVIFKDKNFDFDYRKYQTVPYDPRFPNTNQTK